MKDTRWLYILFIVLFIGFFIWFVTSGNDSATSYRWFAVKGGW